MTQNSVLGTAVNSDWHYFSRITGPPCPPGQLAKPKTKCPPHDNAFGPNSLKLKLNIAVSQQNKAHNHISTGNPLMRGAPPHEGDGGSPSRGYFSLCITIYMRKNHNCKNRQWWLWWFMCPLSMHQFIEISMHASENKITSNISMSSDPWKSVRQRVFPCTAAETIGRTKLQAPYEKKTNSGDFH